MRHEGGLAVTDASDDAGGPVVVGANRYRFAPGEEIVNPHVMSMSFVWVVSGGGAITANGRVFEVESGHVLRLPWHHRVEYRAHRRHPFHIGTLHLIPRHRYDIRPVPRVAHLPGDPLLADPARTGDSAAFLPGLATLQDGAARRISEYATLAIDRLGDGDFDEAYFRALGLLIETENRSWSGGHSAAPPLPGAVELMVTYIRHHIADDLTVAAVAASARCSETTAQRLFRAHLGETVQEWIRRTRLRDAGTLLATTGLRVGEVAHLVGYADPLYFSRAFRRAYGVAPSRFAHGSLRP